MRLHVLLLVVLVGACRAPAPETVAPEAASREAPRGAELTAVVAGQLGRDADAWNRGDLDGFMASYARDTSTSFIDAGHVRYGFEFIRSRYAPRFAPGAERDSLRFEEIAARPLGRAHALVTARFVLFRNGRTTASGPFTLVLERRPEGWKIIHDHSSSDPQ